MIQSFSIPSIFKQKINGQKFDHLVHCVAYYEGIYHKIFFAYFWAVVWMEGCPPEKLWQCYFQWWKKLPALSMFHMSCTFCSESLTHNFWFFSTKCFISTHACKVKKNICRGAVIFTVLHNRGSVTREKKKANQIILLKFASFLDKY